MMQLNIKVSANFLVVIWLQLDLLDSDGQMIDYYCYYYFKILFLTNLYTHCGAHNPEIKSHTLHQVRQPGAPIWFFFFINSVLSCLLHVPVCLIHFFQSLSLSLQCVSCGWQLVLPCLFILSYNVIDPNI